nr:uncharacterized protein LOC102456514 isoform X2 [Pelodiscus sinensis]|eukprot:XP_025033576.1 uncharacterized protein LOC102456514 isoform X2 [Pelodiscus sinensis]
MTQGEEPMDQKPCLKEDFGQDPKEDGRNQGSDVWTHPREWVPGLYRQIRACIGDVTNITFCKCLTSKVTISVYGLIMIVLVAVLVIVSLYLSHPGSDGVCSSGPPAGPGCLDDWVGYRGKCYYFSEVEGNWTNSQTNCSGFRASLVVFDSEQEKVRERDGHRCLIMTRTGLCRTNMAGGGRAWPLFLLWPRSCGEARRSEGPAASCQQWSVYD